MPIQYQRIMIFGRPGSGKSTFAKYLQKQTGYPLYHLDKYFFEANWQERNYEDFLKIQQKIVDEPEWIVDGNSTKSLEMRFKKADLVLYFNFPRFICLLRIMKRFFFKNSTIDDRAMGCPERIRFSLLKYMWTFHQRVQEPIQMLKNKYPQAKFVEIQNDKVLESVKKQLGF